MDLQDIGKDAKLTLKDKAWLNDVAKLLHDEGWYTRAIYLWQMVDNANDI
tara:strand:+ start:472 stop:621 length:150 start_codon:yes stop_codon:yes gene_type:complete